MAFLLEQHHDFVNSNQNALTLCAKLFLHKVNTIKKKKRSAQKI